MVILRNETIRCIVGCKKRKKKALNRPEELDHFNGVIADENAVILRGKQYLGMRANCKEKRDTLKAEVEVYMGNNWIQIQNEHNCHFLKRKQRFYKAV